jgi:YVTN family beta-propeller protein
LFSLLYLIKKHSILRDFALYYSVNSLTGGNAMKNIGNPRTKTFAVVAFSILLAASFVHADFVTDTIPAGTNPYAVAVNPVTNMTYVANYGGGTVTVINGSTSDTVATITVGSNPRAIAVNALTNKIYVANFTASSVSVIDGATNTVSTTVTVQSMPNAIAINPATNRVYVTNYGSASVSVIDGISGALDTTVSVGSGPIAVCTNPVTNRIYVANSGSSSVTVINGADNSISTVTAGTTPYSIASNTVTNKIYVANQGSNNVTIIDGATNGTTNIAAGTSPSAVAVNLVTDTVYVVNSGSNNVTVIAGATGTASNVTVGTNPTAIAINTTTNKIYVANYGSNSISVISAATVDTTLSTGTNPNALAANTITNKIYTSNNGSGNVTVIDGATNLITTITSGYFQNAIAVNPVSNKIYAVTVGNTVTVIDGTTNQATVVATGNGPVDIDVNPVTNKIYVSNYFDKSVTEIDGATNMTKTIAVDSMPYSVAVNPVTNKIYVINTGSKTVTSIDGTTYQTTTIGTNAVASYRHYAIAVNPVTNKIYVPDNSTSSVRVINGATNQVEASISVGISKNPQAVAVNSVTNKIYVSGSGGMSVIDGENNQTKWVATSESCYFAVVNSVTNKIYLANLNSVTVVDGATDDVATIAMSGGNVRYYIAVNPVTNKIYIANGYYSRLSVIDGATNTTEVITLGGASPFVALNPVTNTIYVANGATMSKISIVPSSDTRLLTSFNSIPNNSTYLSQPSISGDAVNRQRPGYTGISAVYQNRNTAQSPWNYASIIKNAGTDSVSWSWAWGPDSLMWGENYLCAVAVDSQAMSTNNLGIGTSFSGNVKVYPIYRIKELFPPASAPVLIAPVIGVGNLTIPIVFAWHSSAGAQNYILQAATDTSFVLLAVNLNSLPDTSQSVSGLTDGTTYYWRVRAGNSDGFSNWSSVWSFTTGYFTVPQTPILSSPANNALGISTTNPVFSWNPAARATSYIVQVSTDSNFFSLAVNDSGITDTSFAINSLSSFSMYYWRVRAVNAVGPSAWSGIRNFITGTGILPPVPILLSPANNAVNQPISSTLRWSTVSGAISYHIQVSTSSSFASLFIEDSTITDTLTMVNGLANSTVYYWRARAKNAGGVSSWTSPWNFTTIIAPAGMPTLVAPANSATDQPISLSLIWNSVSTATSYDVQVATDTGFASLFIEDSTLTDTVKSVNGLASGTVYYWRVRAENSGGASPWSGGWSFTVATPPAIPSLVSPANGSIDQPVSLKIIWNIVSTAASYHVQVATDSGFTALSEEDSLLTDTLMSLSGLDKSATYYWRLRAKNVGGSSAWTSPWSFTTIIATAGTPVLVSPANGATDQATSLSLIWNSVSTATNYHVQIATDTGFASLFSQDSSITDTVKSDSGFVYSTTYYWRVRARNAGGAGNWSEVRSFTVISSGVQPWKPPVSYAFTISGSSGIVRYSLPSACHVSLKYYDLRGRLAASLINTIQGPGHYVLSIKNALPSNGLYVRVFEAGSFIKRELVATMEK